MRRIGSGGPSAYLAVMTDAKSRKGPVQIHAPLQAWFEAKAAERAPEHLVALVDELEAIATAKDVRKAS